ncbi:MAG: START-like domain-containing protein [Paludibacteraceae bacterium]|nr:START-like domain-containing protein [Paludibacteraceae bacterium]
MAKEKFLLEYSFGHVSASVLWNSISTTSGLSCWFADKVYQEGDAIHFVWGKTEVQKAEILLHRNGSYIRYHWLDDENPKSYFELKILCDELTMDVILVVTDFCEADEKEEAIELWNNQIDALKKALGA